MKSIFILLLLSCSITLSAQNLHLKIDFTDPSYAMCMVATQDGGYVLAGATSHNFEVADGALVRLSPSGPVLWSKTIEPLPSYSGLEIKSIAITNDNGFILTGVLYSSSDHDIWVGKCTSEGELLWSKSIGTSADDRSTCILQTQDHGYVIVGNSSISANGGGKAAFVKFDESGNLQWNTLLFPDMTDVRNCYANAILELPDESLIIVGATLDRFTNRPFLCKLEKSGNPIWGKTIKTNGIFSNLVRTHDGNIIACGGTGQTEPHPLFAKFTPEGSIHWIRQFNGFTSSWAYSISELDDHSLHSTGYFHLATGFDGLITIVLTEDGNLTMLRSMDIPLLSSVGCAIAGNSEGGFTIGGYTYDSIGNTSMMLLRSDASFNLCSSHDHLAVSTLESDSVDSSVESIGGLQLHISALPTLHSQLPTITDLCDYGAIKPIIEERPGAVVFPNPIHSSDPIILSIAEIPLGRYWIIVRDILGHQLIRQQQLIGPDETIRIDAATLPNGMYTIELLDANSFSSVWHWKVVKVR